MSAPAPETVRRPDVRQLFGGRPGGISITAEPAHGVLTCTLPGGTGPGGEHFEPLLVRVPSDETGAAALQREARLLVELRRMRLGPVERTIPRHVGMRSFDGLPVAVSSTVPGRPMASHGWLRTAQPWRVRREFAYVAAWLEALHDASGTGPAPTTWGCDVTDAVRTRWTGHLLADAALSRLEASATRLDGCRVEQTAVHGDLGPSNVLVDADLGAVTGVVDWTQGELDGCPLRDLARFALRHARGQRADLAETLLGSGWYSRVVRSHLHAGLDRLGVPRDRWYDVVVAGIGEVAAQDRDERVAEDHLVTLTRLPSALRRPHLLARMA